jgi:bifunctional non-homologous end joining protein LigD
MRQKSESQIVLDGLRGEHSIAELCFAHRISARQIKPSRISTSCTPEHDDEVQLYAFDILALDGDDLRTLPLHLRKTNLARLLTRRPEGIFVSEYERGEIGPDLFRQACKFGLEGLVSKRRESVYRGGRSPHWIKVKNRSHPALQRVKEAFS